MATNETKEKPRDAPSRARKTEEEVEVATTVGIAKGMPTVDTGTGVNDLEPTPTTMSTDKGEPVPDSADGTTMAESVPAYHQLQPPPMLQRDAAGHHPFATRPGAYLGVPGESLQRTTTLDYDLLGVGANATRNIGNDDSGQPTTNLEQQLVEANAVDEENLNNLMHANPVDLEAARQREQKQKTQQCYFVAAIMWLCLIGALVVGFVIGTQDNKDPEMIPLTDAPTSYGSMTPSEVPSSAPTGVLDLLLQALPSYTLTSLQSGNSPQYKAWQWLLNHQNITFLPEWRKTQLFAMATFFYSMEGEQWYPPIKERWMDDTIDECLWWSSGFGFFNLVDGSYFEIPPQYQLPACNDQGELAWLRLRNLNFSGLAPSIPPEMALLTSLVEIELLQNHIDATSLSKMLPPLPELHDMATSLTSLVLGANGILGSLPTELGVLTKLEILDFSKNQLTGEIPSELGLLTSLSKAFLAKNSLSGSLPSELFLATALDMLYLDQNVLTGPIQTEIGKLRNLFSLDMSKNLFTGTVPSELGLLDSLGLGLGLAENSFSGWLPSELGLLNNTSTIDISRNMLSGPLPIDLQMKGTTWLYLGSNKISGQIPSEYGLLESLQMLDLSSLPLLTGAVPSELSGLPMLGYLNLSGSPGLSGTLPDGLCQLQNASCTFGAWGELCTLDFDCSHDGLCGCDCICPHSNNNNVTSENQTV